MIEEAEAKYCSRRQVHFFGTTTHRGAGVTYKVESGKHDFDFLKGERGAECLRT